MLSAQNISNLQLQNAYVIVMACGMLLCILTGGNMWTAIAAALGIALVIGICQGSLIGWVHIPPFICTLAGMFLYIGIARAVLDSQTVSIQSDDYLSLKAGS